MTTQPNAFYFAGGKFIPVPENLWKFFCTRETAEKIFAEALKLDPHAVLGDGLNNELWIPVEYGDDSTKIWAIRGSVPSGNDAIPFDEFAGWLADREVKPNPFIDRMGGPVLGFHDVGGIAELRWGK